MAILEQHGTEDDVVATLVVQQHGEDDSLLGEVKHGVTEPRLRASGADMACHCSRMVVLMSAKEEV
jgi:hypothetical protein